MIPKVIHYCWFGGKPKPKSAENCISSWKRFCQNYEIIEWNETNVKIEDMPLYVRQAYEAKKWAFVTDYVRLYIVHKYGGIYFDTDVEVIKPFDNLLHNTAFFGFEDDKYINTGHGFGAQAGVSILNEMMSDYYDIPFILSDCSFDSTPCPKRNTKAFLRCGLIQDGKRQTVNEGISVLPSEYFAPKNWKTGQIDLTENTYSIHHFDASWYTPEQRKAKKKRLREEKLQHIPSFFGSKILGKEEYERLRRLLKQK